MKSACFKDFYLELLLKSEGSTVKVPVQKAAIECGYTTLYRFDPRNEAAPLHVDSKEPDWSKFKDFLMNETRFNQLVKIKGAEEADKMFDKTLKDAQKRYNRLKSMEAQQG